MKKLERVIKDLPKYREVLDLLENDIFNKFVELYGNNIEVVSDGYITKGGKKRVSFTCYENWAD